MMHYRLFDTASGCGIAWSERGLTRLALLKAESRRDRAARAHGRCGPSETAPAAIDQLIARIQSYTTGRASTFASSSST